MTSVSADTSLSSTTDDKKKNDDIPWELIVIIIAIILGSIVACGLYDYFCVNKVAHETNIAMNSNFHATPGVYGTTPGGTEGVTGTTGAEPDLPFETEMTNQQLNRIDSQSNTGVSNNIALLGDNDLLPALPAQPKVDSQAIHSTNGGADLLAEDGSGDLPPQPAVAVDMETPMGDPDPNNVGADAVADENAGVVNDGGENAGVPIETDGGDTAGANVGEA